MGNHLYCFLWNDLQAYGSFGAACSNHALQFERRLLRNCFLKRQFCFKLLQLEYIVGI